MNSISISGNIGKDAEIRYLPAGDPVCQFSVADNMGKDKGAIWWNCAIFGKRAESLQQYLTKGQQVTVIGTVTEREWVDKEGGKRKSMDVRVQDLALMGGKREAAPATRQAAKPAGGFDEDLHDSEIPF